MSFGEDDDGEIYFLTQARRHHEVRVARSGRRSDSAYNARHKIQRSNSADRLFSVLRAPWLTCLRIGKNAGACSASALRAARCNRSRRRPRVRCRFHRGSSSGRGRLGPSPGRRTLPNTAALLPAARCSNRLRPNAPCRRRTAGRPACSADTRPRPPSRPRACRARWPRAAPRSFPGFTRPRTKYRMPYIACIVASSDNRRDKSRSRLSAFAILRV